MTCEVCESRLGDYESYSDGKATWVRVHCLACSREYRKQFLKFCRHPNCPGHDEMKIPRFHVERAELVHPDCMERPHAQG